MRVRSLLLLLLPAVIPFSLARGQEDEKIFACAAEYVRAGDMNSAFMSLHALVSAYPSSDHAEDAFFSIGEYYFGINDFRDASRTFFNTVKGYPGSKTGVFCYAYLLEIARREKKPEQAEALERALAGSRRLIFLFTESKEFSYTSVLGKTYKAVYYIDKVEIYIDGALFTSVYL